MEHHGRAANQGRDFVKIADVGGMEIDRPTHFLEVAFAPAEQVIDHHDLRGAFAQQGAHNRGADEPRSSRNYVMARHVSDSISLSR